MKKPMMLLCLFLLLATGRSFAQSALKITNNSECVIHVAMYAEFPSIVPPAIGCFALRTDIEVDPGMTLSFPDYATAAAGSTTGGWLGGAILPPPPGPPGFKWTVAQIQKVNTERVHCLHAGCGVQLSAPGSGCPDMPCSTSADCIGVCGTWTIGSLPGDVVISYP